MKGMTGSTVAVLLAAVTTMMTAAADRTAPVPKVLWVASPVLPDETVMVYGGDWGTNATVTLTVIGNDGVRRPAVEAPAVLQVREHGLAFVLPKDDGPHLYEARIAADGQLSETMILNEPTVWWLQGDAGPEASPGGWVRCFGRCLDFDGAAQAVLVVGDRRIALNVTHREMWSLDLALPRELATGSYRVEVHNGLGGEAGWRSAGEVTVRAHDVPWKSDVFDITDFGAVRNDRFCDAPALRKALAAAEANGGGTVFFPRGRYQLTGAFDVPPRTLLKGEGIDLAQIYWPDTDTPPEYLIKGSDGFGIRDLFIQTGHHMDGIVCQGVSDVVIERVRMRLLRDQYVSDDELMRRAALHCLALRISGTQFRVEDCDIYSDYGCHTAAFAGSYGIVRNNRFLGMGGGGFRVDKMTYERNTIHGAGHSMGPGRNVYWAHNTVLRNFVHDRESMTTDGGGNTYKGSVEACEGTTVTLPKAIGWRHGHRHWIGKEMIIMDGRGAGQQRRITDIDPEKRLVTIDRPWTIKPDATSFVMIFEGREHMLFVGNRIEDSTVALQIYGSLVEGVLADNTSARTGGFHTYGMWKGTTPEPLWYVQHIGNRILEGNAYRSPQNAIPVTDAHMQVRDRGHRGADYPFTRCNVIRRCELDSNAHLSVVGGGEPVHTLIEDCVVRHADVGVVVDARPRGVILRRIRMDNVVQPFAGAFADVWLHPAEAALARLQCAQTQLEAQAPAGWDAMAAELEMLADRRVDEAMEDRVRAQMRAALGALNAGGVREIDAELAQALLGLELSFAEHTFLPVVRKGGTSARMLSMFSVPAEIPAYTMDTEAEAPQGWTIRSDSGIRGVPGRGGLRCFLDFTMPEGPKGVFAIPLRLDLQGDGWALTVHATYRRGDMPVADWLVVGPFENKSRASIDTTVHPPELKLDVGRQYDTRDGRRGYEAVQAEGGTVNLLDCFENTDWSVAYGVTALRAARPMSVRLTYGGGTLLFINGDPVGTRWRFSQWGCVELREGINVVQAISSHRDGAWNLRVDVDVIDRQLDPGDLTVVPGKELKTLPALRPPSAAADGSLPHDHGVHWKLVFEDDFERTRLGGVWEGRASASWAPSAWKLVDGTVQPAAAFSTLAYTGRVEPPVRLEFDAYRDHTGTRMLAAMLCPKGMSAHRFWGDLYGYGYLMCLGWHDDFSNSMMRNDERIHVQPDNEALQLEANRWYHVTAMFIPPRCLLYVDDTLVFDVEDDNWIAGLNEVGIFSYPIHRIDNVQIFTANNP